MMICCKTDADRTFSCADTLEGLGLEDYNCGAIAAGALLQYLYETQKNFSGTSDPYHVLM